MNKEVLVQELQKININLSDEQLKQIDDFCLFLLAENKKYNLTAIRDYNETLLKHVYDSLTLSLAVDLNNEPNLLDIGSGAGFPGIIIKIVYPHLDVTLLDSNGKKTNFLKQAIQLLQLENITIVNERAETYIKAHREGFAIVTARAVASLSVLLELAVPFQKITGIFVAMKGTVESEFAEAKEACSFLGCQITELKELTLPFENSKRTLVLVKKLGKTAHLYPRTYDKILKKPLKRNKK